MDPFDDDLDLDTLLASARRDPRWSQPLSRGATPTAAEIAEFIGDSPSERVRRLVQLAMIDSPAVRAAVGRARDEWGDRPVLQFPSSRAVVAAPLLGWIAEQRLAADDGDDLSGRGMATQVPPYRLLFRHDPVTDRLSATVRSIESGDMEPGAWVALFSRMEGAPDSLLCFGVSDEYGIVDLGTRARISDALAGRVVVDAV